MNTNDTSFDNVAGINPTELKQMLEILQKIHITDMFIEELHKLCFEDKQEAQNGK